MQILCHAFVSHSGLLYLCCLNTNQGTGRDQKSPENVKEERERERDKERQRDREGNREREGKSVWRTNRHSLEERERA